MKLKTNKRWFFDLELLSIGKANKKGYRKARCRCRCGKPKTVWFHHLLSGHSKSCGCFMRRLMTVRQREAGIIAVPLYGGGIALISAADADRVLAHRWKRHKFGYAVAVIDGKHVLLHRLVLGLGAGEVADHRFADRLDCTRSNLRKATWSSNAANRKPIGRSGYKGVMPIKGTNRFLAYISAQDRIGHNRYLGRFVKAEEAALAYDRAAVLQYGEFARLNFPERVSA